jgi:hypothetical protein
MVKNKLDARKVDLSHLSIKQLTPGQTLNQNLFYKLPTLISQRQQLSSYCIGRLPALAVRCVFVREFGLALESRPISVSFFNKCASVTFDGDSFENSDICEYSQSSQYQCL